MNHYWMNDRALPDDNTRAERAAVQAIRRELLARVFLTLLTTFATGTTTQPTELDETKGPVENDHVE